ncbi:small ribosomal subunit protein mS37-like [Haliotis cracherodii]|uniref:coiled-coil-helix-coiled-coil-helix domain-containing protein 1-like n=1 Tax=Haliotis rufescens TaxID=6454 RepID=UPI001EAFC29C|nr:coiled-coil-helix-coiled-coil-helix domain-containing protein 1-like [Haliotis rufescens]XP_046361678.1 coiled-coil-helix-coiled-coil-helix domain-containing protein 1-like [Haliotis rufescens]
MPRLNGILCSGLKPLRKFENYKPVPTYKILLPPILKDSVPDTGGKTQVAVCLQQMNVMMACWKNNEFNESKCSEEIKAFSECIEKSNSEARALQQAESLGQTDSVAGKPTSRTINKLLKRYPQPPTTIKVKM